MPSSAAVSPPASTRRRPAWSIPVVVLAVVVVAVAAVIGVRGLMGNPVQSVAPDGTATLSGSYQPVTCDSGCAQGYVQAGGRSVFVRLPAGCSRPDAGSDVTLRARPDPSLGKQAYLGVGCPSH